MFIFMCDRRVYDFHGTFVFYRYGPRISSNSVIKVCRPHSFKLLLQQDITVVLNMNVNFIENGKEFDPNKQ